MDANVSTPDHAQELEASWRAREDHWRRKLGRLRLGVGAIAAGAECHPTVIRPGTQRDRQEQDGVEHQPDQGIAEDREEGEEHHGQAGGDRRERPGHPTVARQLLLDRLDAEPQPAQLPPPDVLPGSPGVLEGFGGIRGRDVRFHGFI